MLQAQHLTLRDAASMRDAEVTQLLTLAGWRCFQRHLISWPRICALPPRHRRDFFATGVPLHCIMDGVATLEQFVALPSTHLVRAVADGFDEWLRQGLLSMEQLARLPTSFIKPLSGGAPFAERCIAERAISFDDILLLDLERVVLVLSTFRSYLCLKRGVLHGAQIASLSVAQLSTIIANSADTEESF